jgi:hypothetical protein
MKEIKQFNIGDCHGKRHFFIGAHSVAHAVRLLNEAEKTKLWKATHLKTYGSPCWGDAMKAVAPQVGVWIENPRFSKKIMRLL